MSPHSQKFYDAQHDEFDTATRLEKPRNRLLDTLEFNILHVGKIGGTQSILLQYEFVHVSKMQNE